MRNLLTGLQSRYHDEEVHQGIVDFSSAGLDDVDIFTPDRVLDLAAGLADRELGEETVARRNAQDVADAVDQLWM